MSQKIKKKIFAKHNKGTTKEKMGIDIIPEMLPMAINCKTSRKAFIKAKNRTNIFFRFIEAVCY
jgi:hypothetical protein